jgi:hypothetical protein
MDVFIVKIMSLRVKPVKSLFRGDDVQNSGNWIGVFDGGAKVNDLSRSIRSVVERFATYTVTTTVFFCRLSRMNHR